METHHDGGWWDLVVVQEMELERDETYRVLQDVRVL
jgi:hypothetical protein